MVTQQQYTVALKIVIEYSQQELQRLAIGNAELMREAERMNSIMERVENMVIMKELRKVTRVREVVTIRQSLMWWIRENTDLTFNAIGSLLMAKGAKDSTKHCNALHAHKICSKVTRKIDSKLFEAKQWVSIEMAGLEKRK